MRAARLTFALALMSIGFAPMAKAVPACAPNAKVPANARVFAKTTDQSTWNEYSDFDHIPAVTLENGTYALYWQPKKKIPSVYLVQMAQGCYLQTRYCFDSKGQLEDVEFEIGTSLGWGHRQEGPILSGRFDANKVEFFRTSDGKPIGTPFGPGQVPRALMPRLYQSVGDLPFASLLGLSQETARK